jgi:hypothetical protein
LAKSRSFVGGRSIVQQEQSSGASGGGLLLLYKILQLLFFTLVRILCALKLESRKRYQNEYYKGTVRISVSWTKWMFHQIIQNLSLCLGIIGKTRVLMSLNSVLNKFLSASAITIIYWQDVSRCYLCSAVKECGTKRAHSILFPKSVSESETLQN